MTLHFSLPFKIVSIFTILLFIVCNYTFLTREKRIKKSIKSMTDEKREEMLKTAPRVIIGLKIFIGILPFESILVGYLSYGGPEFLIFIVGTIMIFIIIIQYCIIMKGYVNEINKLRKAPHVTPETTI